MTRILVVFAILMLVGPAASLAAPPMSSPPSAPSAGAPAERPPESVAPDELGRGSPRGTVQGFLQATATYDYARAARYLDLRGRPLADIAKGPEMARQLRVILDNTRIDLAALADEPEGRREAGMRGGVQTVSRVELDNATMSIQLERVPRDDGLLIWQFSRETLRHVPNLHWRFSYGLVGRWLPPVFVETRILGLALWQWIGLLVLAGVSLLIAWAVVRPGLPLMRRFLSLTRFAPTDDPALGKAVGPLRTLLALAIFRIGQPALSLPVLVLPVVSAAQQILLVVALTWMVLRFVDVTTLHARHRAIGRGDSPTLIDLIQRAARILVVTLSALLLFEAVGVQPTTLIAAVGVGSIGIALAAQRTVENLFGGLVVIGDQPVRVGDLCRIGERQGTVERIGLWSTRIRTLERSVVSVPNAQFFTLHVDNLQRRDRLLFETRLRLRYETTPDQLRAVLARIRDALSAHPLVDPDPARVRLVGFGSDALQVEVFAYLRTTDYERFVAAREELCLGFMDIVAAAGTAFAPPAQIAPVASR
ncbi:MAG: mechanosensitive ion channel family protein [Candidatus Rokuibacteriota bacterium]